MACQSCHSCVAFTMHLQGSGPVCDTGTVSLRGAFVNPATLFRQLVNPSRGGRTHRNYWLEPLPPILPAAGLPQPVRPFTGRTNGSVGAHTLLRRRGQTRRIVPYYWVVAAKPDKF